MERDDLALEGLLRELARAPEGDDDAFVARVLAGTRKSEAHRPAILAAAVLLIGMSVLFAFPPAPATGRMELRHASCLVHDATQMRVLMKEPGTDRLLLLGQAPLDADVRVPRTRRCSSRRSAPTGWRAGLRPTGSASVRRGRPRRPSSTPGPPARSSSCAT